MNRRKLSVAIPASVVSDTPHLREKTSKVGLIGRAAAIFRVDEIIVFSDAPGRNQNVELRLISKLLSYLETPQYLRKRLFKLDADLQYAGVLPPLRTPHHPLNSRMDKLKVGEFREGVTLSCGSGQTLVDIGVEQPVLLDSNDLQVGRRITVKVVKIGKTVTVTLADRSDAPVYWGYCVSALDDGFGSLLRKHGFDLAIATSKYGSAFVDQAEQLGGRWKEAKNVLVAFGATNMGLHEIVRREGYGLDNLVDFVVNTVPFQGTETVRTEEAIVASLAVFNVCEVFASR